MSLRFAAVFWVNVKCRPFVELLVVSLKGRLPEAPIPRDPRDLLVGGPIDLVAYQASYRIQLARAQRAIDRFAHFDNEAATAESVAHLFDAFLDAVVVIHHCRDWFAKEMQAEGLEGDLRDLLESPTQKVVADIANASKHATRDRRRRSSGNIMMHIDRTSAAESVADFYRRMRLQSEVGSEHPTDFLHRAYRECDRAAMTKIAIPKFHKRHGAPTDAIQGVREQATTKQSGK
jgi:hypothetical protein